MATVDEILKEFPPGVRQLVEPVYTGLPPDRQQQLGEMLRALKGSDVRGVRQLLDLVLDQYRPLAGHKERIAIVGPANVGKSSLYNQFIRRAEDKAAVGPVPGVTKISQQADAGLFLVVDTPGADVKSPAGRSAREDAFKSARAADLLIVVFDASRGVTAAERGLYDELTTQGRPHVVVLNKIDLVRIPDRQAVITAASSALGLGESHVITASAATGESVGQVLLAVAKAEPELLLAMGRALPAYRFELAWPRVIQAAAAAGVIALTPLPVASFVPLVTIQVGMILNIAGLYGHPMTLARARELIATFGAAFGARMLFQQLAEVVPVAGWVLSAAIASTTTAAMGYAAIRWFGEGIKVSGADLQDLTRRWTKAVAARMPDGRRPAKGTIRGRLEDALSEIVLPVDRGGSKR